MTVKWGDDLGFGVIGVTSPECCTHKAQNIVHVKVMRALPLVRAFGAQLPMVAHIQFN